MTVFQIPTLDTAHDEARPLLEGPQKHLGFVPNLLLALSTSPPTLTAYLDLGKHLTKVGLTGIEMQTVLIVASVENACAYCVAAHSTFASNVKIDAGVLQALREGRESTDAKLNVLAAFVRALIHSKGRVTAAELDGFLSAGYTREQGLGILIGVAIKTIANLANHLMKTPLDPQFEAQRWTK
jgi:uncharacterized peroxidase-related enzyme